MNIVPKEELILEMPALAAKAMRKLPEIMAKSSTGPLSEAIAALAESCLLPDGLKPELKKFLSAVVEELILCIYAKSSLVNLNSSQEAILSAYSSIMSNIQFRKRCHDLFSQEPIIESTFNPFFSKFCEQLLFISIQFKLHNISKSKHLGQLESSKTSIVHYVGGFIIRGFANKCWKFQNKNKQFKQRLLCIQNNFVESDSNNTSPASKSSKLWTAKLNRGGLLILGANATTFFIRLTLIINTHKLSSKSLAVSDVLNEVYLDSPIIETWTNLTPELKEQQRFIFLDGVVKAFTNLIGHATAKKEFRRYEVRQDAAIRTKLKK
jgi:hypothetical protein